jgi:hypothetical protein
MSRARDLARLVPLVGLIRDLALMDVANAAHARQASLDRLADMEPLPAANLDPVAEARSALRYQVWADQRRAELAPVLIRQTETLAQAEEAARRALGRAEVLKSLAERPR